MRRNSLTITPHDVNDLPKPITALYVGSTGNITIQCSRDSASVTLIAVPAGTFLDNITVKKILATGTTASNLVGFF